MKILIVGGKGFIGSHLFSQLEKQASVTCIDNINDPIEKDFINVDLTNINQVINFAVNCDNFDVLIFLVGIAYAKGKGKDLTNFKNVNYQTLVNLLSALDNNNKIPEKIMFTSTISVYGERYDQKLYNENLEPCPFSPYAVTKHKAEQYLLDGYPNKSWILRSAPIYSADFLLHINLRTKISNWFFKVGDGKTRLSLCNIENIKTAIEGILNEKVPADIYNISDNEPYMYRELLEWQHATFTVRIPKIIVKTLYKFGKIFANIFLQENTVKLLTDNIYPSKKIRAFIELPHTLKDVQPNMKDAQ